MLQTLIHNKGKPFINRKKIGLRFYLFLFTALQAFCWGRNPNLLKLKYRDIDTYNKLKKKMTSS